MRSQILEYVHISWRETIFLLKAVSKVSFPQLKKTRFTGSELSCPPRLLPWCGSPLWEMGWGAESPFLLSTSYCYFPDGDLVSIISFKFPGHLLKVVSSLFGGNWGWAYLLLVPLNTDTIWRKTKALISQNSASLALLGWNAWCVLF